MASYTIPTGQFAAHDKVLVASTVDTVTFTDGVTNVEVLSDGTAAIYFTVDGTTPTVSGGRTKKIPAGGVSSLVVPAPTEGGVVVKLISGGTPTYSVSEA